MRHLQSCMQVHLDLACKASTDKEEEFKKLEDRIDALENRPYTWKIEGFEEILRRTKTGNNFRLTVIHFILGNVGINSECACIQTAAPRAKKLICRFP